MSSSQTTVEARGNSWVVLFKAMEFHCANEEMARQMARKFQQGGGH